MTSYRVLIITLAIVVSVSLKSARSQEAVESKPDRITEEPTIETAPTPQEQPAEEKRTETSSQTTGEETPKKKTKKKAPTEQSGKVLQDSMTAEEFRAAGLEKLSADELANLNAWLQGYRQATETKAAEKATAETTKKVTEEVTAQAHQRLNRVESRVDGTVPHLTGHSTIKLEDGTVWRQANAEDRYSSPPIDHPKAVVTRGVFGWKMRISGLPEFYVDLLNQ
jgi:type IV secretory pathway VirB10-like protein